MGRVALDAFPFIILQVWLLAKVTLRFFYEVMDGQANIFCLGKICKIKDKVLWVVDIKRNLESADMRGEKDCLSKIEDRGRRFQHTPYVFD